MQVSFPPDKFPIPGVVLGADISRYQASADGTKRFDFDKFLAAGGKFLFIRAGVGANGEDFQFRYNLQEAKARGIPVALYHVLKAGKSVQNQIVTFTNLSLDPVSGKPVAEIGDYYDMELNEDNLSKQEYTNNSQKIIQGHQANMPDGHREGIYTRATFIDQASARNDWMKVLDLFLAHWMYAITDYSAPPPTLRPWIPDNWGAINNPVLPLYWQFTNKGNGKLFGSNGDDDIDLIFWLNTPLAFELMYGVALPGDVAPPPPPPPPAPPPAETFTARIKDSDPTYHNIYSHKTPDILPGSRNGFIPVATELVVNKIQPLGGGMEMWRSGSNTWFAGWLAERLG